MSETAWLKKCARLNVYKQKHGLAPHKPLLLLVVLERMRLGELAGTQLDLTPELSFQFDTFWNVVSYRRPQPPDVRLPFHHLGGDGFWIPFTEEGEPSPHRSLTRWVEVDPTFLEIMQDTKVLRQAERILILKYFEAAERHALYSLLEMDIPDEDAVAQDANFLQPGDAVATGREARFRLDIVAAYNYTCALSGYRVTTIGRGTIVDAAHIHQFSDSRNNDPKNGLALSKNAHWMFDVGLWSLTDDFRIVVAVGHFSEGSPDQVPLEGYAGKKIRLPANDAIWPSLKHLSWHRTHRFLGDR